jgi:SAM-dependent methyltransferase
MSLPNVGDRLASRIHEELGVRSFAELVDAAVKHRLQSLPGIGSRREQQILEAARGMVEVTPEASFEDLLRCPGCGQDGLEALSASVRCPVCRREYGIEHGVFDLAPPGGRQSRSVTQRLMESRFYARFYEDVMRPRLTNVVTARTLPEEYVLAADYLELRDARAVLDVACGTGNFTRHFARVMLQTDDPGLIVGADISWSMLETARHYLRRGGLSDYVRLMRANAARFPLATDSFDRIHCAGALHMMQDIDGALREFARLLEPGGICVVGTFVLGRGWMRRVAKRVAELPTRFHWFAPDELHARMARVGLTVVEESVEGDALTVKAIRE